MSGNFAIKGGVGCLMANAILNFHFDFLNPSLSYNCQCHRWIAKNWILWMSNQSMADGDVFLSPSLNNRRLSFSRQRQQALCATSNKNHQQRRQRASVPGYHRWTYNPSTLEKFSLILLKSIWFPSLPVLGGFMKQICVIMSCMFLRLHS